QVVEADLVFRIAALPLFERPRADAAADVAQRAQALFDVRIDRLRRLCLRRAGRPARNLAERALECGDALRIRVRQVGVLARIRLQVVELAPRRGDELVAPVAYRGQLAPAVVIARIPALGQRQ